MTLKLVRRGKIWYLRGTVAKVRVFETTATSEREDAEAYRIKREREVWQRRRLGPESVIGFEEAVLSYLQYRAPGPSQRALIGRLLDHFGNATLSAFDQDAIDRACGAVLKPGAAPATRLRNVITPLSAILRHGAKRGWCAMPAFDRPRQPKGRTVWLTPAEAERLISASADHLKPLIVFYLCTGARASEALDLQWADVDLAAGICALRATKNGRDRIVKLPPAGIAALAELKGRDKSVFRRPDGKPYADRERAEGGQFKTAFKGALKRAGIAKPVTPHALRHTWATWYYAATLDPLRLKGAGGWASLALVERYAHLMPSALVPDVARIWGAAHPDDWESSAKFASGALAGRSARADVGAVFAHAVSFPAQ